MTTESYVEFKVTVRWVENALEDSVVPRPVTGMPEREEVLSAGPWQLCGFAASDGYLYWTWSRTLTVER